eukprot:scaffold389403_cov42-Prasinocladus_malaysianus.AAC.1
MANSTNNTSKLPCMFPLRLTATHLHCKGIAEHLEDFYLKAFEAIIHGIANGVKTAKEAVGSSSQQ